IAPSVCGMVAFIVWALVNGWQRHQQIKRLTDFNTRLVDRIGSVKDFSEFLQTEGGARFMNDLTVERGSLGPRARILRAIEFGITFISLGVGLIIVGRRFYAMEQHEGFTVFGVIALSLGLGCLVSAVASYRVAGMLGVLDRNE